MRRRLQVQGVPLRAEAAGDAEDQARAAKALRRRAGIGHLRSEHRMGRNYLWHREGDAVNAVLAAVGYNLINPA